MVVITPDSTLSDHNGISESHKHDEPWDPTTNALEGDSFETASSGESESDQEEQLKASKDDFCQKGDSEIPHLKGDSFQDALSDEELRQRELEQANDAKAEGNKLFAAAQFEEALSKYVFALEHAPEIPSSLEIRSICHANSAACYFKLGKYEDTVKECTKALELNPSYLKALARRREAQERLEHFEEAVADTKMILELDPTNDQARRSLPRLETLAGEKREKMKEEMIGKLKEMGNSLLGRFGMSLDNFKAVKDPNTGSYSISFQR